MGRWGLSELAAPGSGVVGLMSHFASADTDPAFTEAQLARVPRGDGARTRTCSDTSRTAPARFAIPTLAPRRSPLRDRRSTASRPSAPIPARTACGPALRWESSVALVKTLEPGESTGYGRRFVAARADPDRDRPGRLRGRVPTRHDGHRGRRRGAAGAGRRDGLDGRRCRRSCPTLRPSRRRVTLVGDGVLIEEHARVSGTIPYEIACGIVSRATRSEREVVDE